MSDNTIDQQFIEYIVKSLVANPDDVIVERKIDEKGVLLTLTVNPEDLGRVIGKRGATAQSMRTLLRALGTKQEARFNLKITDNGVERPEREDDQSNDSATEDESRDEPREESPKNVEQDQEDGWNSGVASDDDSDDDGDDDEDENESRFDKTRRELADLDDLDV